MAEPDFEATWYPRIGKKAAEELRRGRKISIIGIPSGLFAIAAGLLIGTGTLNDVIGVALAAVVVGYFVMFINAQRRTAAALSERYGVKITGRGLPKMNPTRFDGWCKERGLLPAPKLRQDEQVLWSRAASVVPGWRSIAGTLNITSERVTFIPARFGSLTTPMPKVDQFAVSDFQSVDVPDPDSVPSTEGTRQFLSFVFRGDRELKVAVDRADEALVELRALLPIRQGV
jgi:hypothetical protein